MNKKYQVFISSTYIDLVDERKEVIQALLELDCIPVGMEMFPAADDDQWTLIKRLIDDCDYYMLIVGGRYGSLNETGISFTQMEYEYALQKEIPIISFLPKNPGNIPVSKAENASDSIVKLNDFKELVQQKMCRHYEKPADLGSQVSRSLIRLIKDKPRDGWIKASGLPSEELTNEILELRNQNDILKRELDKSMNKVPEGIGDLSQGEDTFNVTVEFHAQGNNYNVKPYSQYYTSALSVTWNQIFAAVSPIMIDETNEASFKNKINEFILNESRKIYKDQMNRENRQILQAAASDDDFQTIKIQLRALNMITESIKKRAVSDKNKYWILTPYGDSIMTKLRAIKKSGPGLKFKTV